MGLKIRPWQAADQNRDFRKEDMRYILENSELRAEIDTFGAEIKSVVRKSDGREYIWCGDPAVWGRTAPVLFPFVGALNGRKYTFEGRDYPMPSHGFARDLEHEVIKKSDTEICFSLKDNAATYKNYPFHFEFQNSYRLDGDRIYVTWKVLNPGQDRTDQKLYFSVGAHPAFACPIHGEKDKTGYKLFFEGLSEVHHHGNLTGTCTREDLTLPLTDNRAVIDSAFFERSTYIVENRQTGSVGIEDPAGHRYITVDFDMPLFAVWSPAEKNAPFICIEPWCGRADYDDYTGDLPSREYGNTLRSGENFENTYSIRFE